MYEWNKAFNLMIDLIAPCSTEVSGFKFGEGFYTLWRMEPVIKLFHAT